MPRQAQKKSGKGEDPGPAVKLPSKRKRSVSAAGETVSSDDGEDSDSDFEITPTKAKKSSARKPKAAATEKANVESSAVSGKGDMVAWKVPQVNLLKGLDQLMYGPVRNKPLYLKMVGNHFVDKSIKQLTAADYAGRFIRRITALAWHPKYPYVLASASKFGDIMMISGVNTKDNGMKFDTKAEVQGGGAGYSVTAMKFHQDEMSVLYRSSIDCTVARVDLARGETVQYHDTGDYNIWFCGMDVNFSRNMILAGDNKGTAYKFSLDGKLQSKLRLHKNKIHCIEFSKMDPNLLVTSSLDKNEAVRIWDIRFLKESSKHADFTPLKSLPHECGLNCAKFSPVDGSRLLTSDQNDEIRVYSGPLWEDYLTIKHHHKQFQHITPIKADWHPLNDYIVIGRYPRKSDTGTQNLARAIEFFDSYTGMLVDMVYPPLDEICSLNVFNPTGEYLATGMNSKLILWKPGIEIDAAENSKPTGGKSTKNISDAMRNALRGRTARGNREFSPTSDNDDDNEDTTTKKKKRSKASTATKAPTKTTTRKKK